jgi:hypothetical protein
MPLYHLVLKNSINPSPASWHDSLKVFPGEMVYPIGSGLYIK